MDLCRFTVDVWHWQKLSSIQTSYFAPYKKSQSADMLSQTIAVSEDQIYLVTYSCSFIYHHHTVHTDLMCTDGQIVSSDLQNETYCLKASI